MDKEGQPIRTFAIEYSKQSYSKCIRCLKPIPRKSLRAAIVIRKDKKQKKSQAEHQWCHFNCWKVPEELTKRPIEIFRGYPDLKDKDKKRVEKLIKAGTGVTWKDLQQQLLKKVEEEKATTETETQESSSGHTYFNNNNNDDDDDDLESTQKEKTKDNKKNKKKVETEDIDMTARLTGIQSQSSSSDKQQKKPKKKNDQKNNNNNNKKSINNTTNNNNKINKKNQPKVQQEHQQKILMKLSNSQDQLELEAITKEIQSTLNK